MNQLSLITPMPKAWDRTDAGQARASYDVADIPAVYDYLVAQNGTTQESNDFRGGWADSPVWSVVSGPWRLQSYATDGMVTFVPNENYSGPNKPHLSRVPPGAERHRRADVRAAQGRAGRAGRHPDRLAVRDGAHRRRRRPAWPTATGWCRRTCSWPGTCRSTSTTTRLPRRSTRTRTSGGSADVPGPGPGDPRDLPRQRVPDERPGAGVAGQPVRVAEAAERPDAVRHRGAARCSRRTAGMSAPPPAAACTAGHRSRLLRRGRRDRRPAQPIRYVEGKAALERLLEMYREDAAKAGIELKLEPVYGSVMVAGTTVRGRRSGSGRSTTGTAAGPSTAT